MHSYVSAVQAAPPQGDAPARNDHWANAARDDALLMSGSSPDHDKF
jgi:hypothetical protein